MCKALCQCNLLLRIRIKVQTKDQTAEDSVGIRKNKTCEWQSRSGLKSRNFVMNKNWFTSDNIFHLWIAKHFINYNESIMMAFCGK